jgi:hypothetical protein
MGDVEIERLIETQARGEVASHTTVSVERTPPPVTELDIRRSKSGLFGGSLLDQAAFEPPEAAADETPAQVPEPGALSIERQDLALAQDLRVPTDDDLGLVFRRDSL